MVNHNHARLNKAITKYIKRIYDPLIYSSLSKSQYKCNMCGGIFEKGLTDEEAIAEAESKGLNVSDCDLVCDDCYKKTPWGKAKQWKMK